MYLDGHLDSHEAISSPILHFGAHDL
jgi:hypothetical protein